MAHHIHAIITSFPYAGPPSQLPLQDTYHLIPVNDPASQEELISPYENLSPRTRELLKALSLQGTCAYIETNYFGGLGTQVAEIWENGVLIVGPLVSFDGVENRMQNPNITVVEAAINQALQTMGRQAQAGKDEFDTLGLGRFRSSRKVWEVIRDQG